MHIKQLFKLHILYTNAFVCLQSEYNVNKSKNKNNCKQINQATEEMLLYKCRRTDKKMICCAPKGGKYAQQVAS